MGSTPTSGTNTEPQLLLSPFSQTPTLTPLRGKATEIVATVVQTVLGKETQDDQCAGPEGQPPAKAK